MRDAGGFVLSFALAALVGCTTPNRGECGGDSDCEGALVCRARRCVAECTDCDAGPVDAPRSDAPLADGAVEDGGPCVDSDGDGVCAGPDCNDGDDGIGPTEAEVCTPNDGSPPADENCDGRMDEGCSYSLGVPHAVIAVQTGPGDHFWPRPSADGLRVCFANGNAMCATRTGLDMPFGAPTTALSIAGSSITAFELSTDGNEAYVELTPASGEAGLYRVVRGGVTFGPPTLVAARHFHPALSPDGLELFAQDRPGAGMTPRIVRATRSSTSADFGEMMPVELGSGTSGEGAPFVAADGSLFFTRAVGFIQSWWVAPRGTPPARFGTAVALPALDASASHLAYHQANGELFFAAGGPWSTGRYTIFRARVCRSGPCPAFVIPCDDASTRSPDGTHCYARASAASSYDAATDACATDGMHVATLHSVEEAELVLTGGAAGLRWVGLSRVGGAWSWVSGEPFSYQPWASGEPGMGIDSYLALVTVGAGGLPEMESTRNLGSYTFRCETEVWPTW